MFLKLITWGSKWVGFNIPPDTILVISGMAFAGKIARTYKNKKFNPYRKFNFYEMQNRKNDLNLKQ